MHKLLSRQIKRHKLSTLWVEEGLTALQNISDAYGDFEKEKNLIERSLDLVSEELNERNQILKSKLLLLENTHNQLAESLSVLNSIFDSTGEAIVALDRHGKLIRVNHMAEKTFNLSLREHCQKSLFVLLNMARKIKKPSKLYQQLKYLKTRPYLDIFGTLELVNNEVFEYHSSAQVVGEQLNGRVWCFRNITKVKENELLIKHQAFHDGLTGLPNRLLLQDRLNQAIHFAHRSKTMVAIMFIDLDHFKKINDTLGHQSGDELLIEVSKRIGACLRETDTIARMGGDEFVVVMGNVSTHKSAASMSNKILEKVTQSILLNNSKYYISCSIGISLYPRDDGSGEELLRKADLAMYHAKEEGRNGFQFFNNALERLAHYNLDLENKLRNALKREEFNVYYQPKINLKNNKIDKMEALLRWNVDGKSMVSPAEFIPLAEKLSLIVPLTYWVIENVCQQIKAWQINGIKNIVISINLSAQQFLENDFIEQVQVILKRYQLSGNSFDWEITETTLLEDLQKVKETLSCLKALGSSISIDDFGTGYSSLQYLQKLPIDTLKIDRSFIVDLEEKPSEESLVSGIISLAHNLKLEVVGEGVENIEMVDYLKRKKCDYIQGFYFYKPMNSKEMTNILKSQV